MSIIIFLLARLLFTAWVADDAYITFRVVDNIVNGFGATWNVHERVQVYTHPLWMLLHVPFQWLFKNIYLVTIALSLVCFLSAVYLSLSKTKHSLQNIIMFFLLPLSLSVPVMDYAISGLENPLGMLLIAWFCRELLTKDRNKPNLYRLSLITALVIMTRMDYVLLVAPMWLYLLIIHRTWRDWLHAISGSWPLLLWGGFCIIYYGFIFPNTKYAKLGAEIPQQALMMQGFYYLQELLLRDILSFLYIIFIPVIVLIFSLKNTLFCTKITSFCTLKLLTSGGVLYCAYIISVGGDFMGGRFWAIPFFLFCLISLHLVPTTWNIGWRRSGLYAAIMIALATVSHVRYVNTWNQGCTSLGLSVAAGDNDKELCSIKGIIDERKFYQRMTGFFNRDNFTFRTEAEGIAVNEGLTLREFGSGHKQQSKAIGMAGFYAGPNIILVDIFALADPLLARLPARASDWRIGHFERHMPEGYLEAINGNAYSISDTALAEYYEKLQLVISGKLMDPDRAKTILRFQTGQYDHLLEKYKKRLGGSN